VADNPKEPYGNVTYADPGYQSDGKKRYPLDSEEHCRAAWSYINMPKNASAYSAEQLSSIKSKIRAALKRYGVDMANDSGRAVKPPRMCYRAFDFRAEGSGDGHTLEGYAAVFNQVARVPASSFEPEFDELIERGAFNRTLRARKPVLQFDHGLDPRTGSVPIGAFEAIQPEEHGLYVRAKLFDNPVVDPIRQAIAGGAISGMSFKMRVNDDSWTRRGNDVDLRAVREVELWELGPVVFPVYEQTSVGVRSMLAFLDKRDRDALVRALADELGIRVPTELALMGTSDVLAEPDRPVTSGLSVDARARRLALLTRSP
jgi:HK97 family phage prohead protease